MFEFFKSQILAGEYDLLKMRERIMAVYAAGQLTIDEFNQLLDLAGEHADPVASLAPIEDRFNVILQKVSELTAAVEALGVRVDALEAGEGTEPTDPEDEPTEPVDDIPEWVQPLDGHDAYKLGDKVRFEGKVYESLLPANVWSPSVYPAGWKEVIEETAAEGNEE